MGLERYTFRQDDSERALHLAARIVSPAGIGTPPPVGGAWGESTDIATGPVFGGHALYSVREQLLHPQMRRHERATDWSGMFERSRPCIRLPAAD
jgi:hypothetical protein